nr:hypothetical protein GCM10020092_078040 [Actinoplanes digitatis]
MNWSTPRLYSAIAAGSRGAPRDEQRPEQHRHADVRQGGGVVCDERPERIVGECHGHADPRPVAYHVVDDLVADAGCRSVRRGGRQWAAVDGGHEIPGTQRAARADGVGDLDGARVPGV